MMSRTKKRGSGPFVLGSVAITIATSIAVVACTHDFDAYQAGESTPEGTDGSTTLTDAATSSDGAVKPVTDSGKAADTGTTTGTDAGCSAAAACAATETSCNAACDATQTTCMQMCGGGGGNNGCKSKCKFDHDTCATKCTTTCHSCAGAACTSSCN